MHDASYRCGLLLHAVTFRGLCWAHRLSHAKQPNRSRCRELQEAISVSPSNQVLDWGPDHLRERDTFDKGHVPARSEVLPHETSLLVRDPKQGSRSRSAFAAARATTRRCGLLPNYFGHLFV